MVDVKYLFEVLTKAGKIDEYQKIIDLVKEKQELVNENIELKKENRELIEKLNLQNDLEFKNNAYWKKSNNDGPFCSRCWDKNKEMIRIHLEKEGWSKCFECKNDFNLTGKEMNSEFIVEEEKFNKFDIF